MKRSPGAALLFGGQGDARTDFVPRSLSSLGVARCWLERASLRWGIDLLRALALGSPDLLRTEVAQPVLVAQSLAGALALHGRGFVPDIVAGHSLGELSAFAAAGCLSPEEAVDLACSRGVSMARAARACPGYMVAITAADFAEVEKVLAVGRRRGSLDVAAHNTPTQWVLTGSRQAVAEVENSRTSVRLSVEGPWHSSLMQTARVEWLAELRRIGWRAPRVTLVSNRTGRPVEAGEDLAERLAGQLTRPIQWVETMRTIERMGVSEVLLLGSTRTLRGLCRANLDRRVSVRILERKSSAMESVS